MAWCAARFGAGMTPRLFRFDRLALPAFAAIQTWPAKSDRRVLINLLRPWRQPKNQVPTVFSWLVALCTAAALAIVNAGLILAAVNATQRLSAFVPGHRASAMERGQWLFTLEQRLHIGIEPWVQQRALQGISTPLFTISGAALQEAAVWIYTHAYPTWLISALVWTYLFRRYRFAVLRDTTIISGFLVVACYRFLPTAPPRFILSGAPYYLQDWTHGGSAAVASAASVIGFNPFAAFPSSHVLWALIPAVCLLRGCRIPWVWMVGLLFPAVMFVTVMVTGNHYVMDAVGAVTILTASYLMANVLAIGRRFIVHRAHLPVIVPYTGRDLPAALALAMACAGGLALSSSSFSVRASVAVAILIAVVNAVIQNNRRAGPSVSRPVVGAKAEHYHYLAGLLFVAGATSALRAPGTDTRLCALLWLLSSVCALAAHAGDRRHVFPKGWREPLSAEDQRLRRRRF